MTKALIAALVVLLLPMVAAAQTTQRPLVLERLHNPIVVAPDYKITDIDGDTGQLAGAYAGKLLGDILFVGGGFYWLVMAHDDFFVFEPQVNATVQVIPHVGVEVGGGYRLSGATNALEDRLNGVSGNVGVQLAW